MTSNAADKRKTNDDDPMKQTMLIMEHKIRNLEKRKLKLEGYIQHLHGGVKLTEDQLLAVSKLSEVTGTLDFARNLKKQLGSLITTKPKKVLNPVVVVEEKLNTKIKEVLIFQDILENIKNETVRNDLLNGFNGAIQLTTDDLSKLSHFSKMVSPKRIVEEGKPLFEDQLKAVSKHYMKLVENRPNIVIGTSYAHLKECLLKIEKSGYLNYMIKARNEEATTSEKVNSLNEVPQSIRKIDSPLDPVTDFDSLSISSVNNLEYNLNKIETVYFTNNNVSGSTVDKGQPHQETNTMDTLFNSSFEFLQDSLLDDDIYSVNPNSIPTQTFSSSHYKNDSTDNEKKLNNLKSEVNASDSWTEKDGGNWHKNTETGVDNLPKENWSQAVMNSTNNDWIVKNNWVHMAETDMSEQITSTSTSQTNPSLGLVTNGYPENLNELLKNSVVFNKQDTYPVANPNNSTYYQNNYRHRSQENNIDNYTNSRTTYYDKNQSTDFNKRSAAVKSKTSYAGEYWRN